MEFRAAANVPASQIVQDVLPGTNDAWPMAHERHVCEPSWEENIPALQICGSAAPKLVPFTIVCRQAVPAGQITQSPDRSFGCDHPIGVKRLNTVTSVSEIHHRSDTYRGGGAGGRGPLTNSKIYVYRDEDVKEEKESGHYSSSPCSSPCSSRRIRSCKRIRLHIVQRVLPVSTDRIGFGRQRRRRLGEICALSRLRSAAFLIPDAVVAP